MLRKGKAIPLLSVSGMLMMMESVTAPLGPAKVVTSALRAFCPSDGGGSGAACCAAVSR